MSAFETRSASVGTLIELSGQALVTDKKSHERQGHGAIVTTATVPQCDHEKGCHNGTAIPSPPLPPPPPDGGMKAWLVAFGGFSTMCCTLGYLNSFGYLLKDESLSAISWIGSVQGGLLFLGGLVSGPLMDRYGIRAVLVPASITLVFSVMMTSLATKYYQLFLSQGLLEGFCFGMIYSPAVSTVGQYFDRHRALAMGVVATGASIGGIIWPVTVNKLLNHSSIGFGWTVRIVGFVMTALLLFASIVMVEHAPRRTNRLLLPEAFQAAPYTLMSVGFFVNLFGLWGPIYFIVDYATSIRGVGTSRAFNEVAILNGMSFFGRYLSGAAADRLGRLNILSGALCANGILLFCWTLTKSYASVTAFTALYGVTSGAIVSLYPTCVAQVCPRPSDIGTYIGMSLALSSLSALLSGPINGALIDRYGYFEASLFGGLTVFLGAALVIWARLVLDRRLLKAV